MCQTMSKVLAQFVVAIVLALFIISCCERPVHHTHGKPMQSSLQSRPSTTLLNSTICIRIKLFSKTKMCLQIAQHGSVSGTTNCSSKFVEMELLPVTTGALERGLKMVKGTASGRYLGMNILGTVYSTKVAGEETVFKQTHESNNFHTFASFKFYQRVLYDTFVAVKRNGRIKPGMATSKLQKPTHFVVVVLPQSC